MAQVNKLSTQASFVLKELRPLLDAKCIGFVVAKDEDFGDDFVGLVFKLVDDSRKQVWILADEEGNGPGFPSVEPYEGDLQ